MKTFLISEDYIKSESTIDNNVSGKYIQQAIKLAQDIALQEIIGTKLYNYIQDNISTLESPYIELLEEYIQPYLLYKVLSEIIIPITYKISNFGLVNTNDENESVSDQVDKLRTYYDNKANVYKKRLQDYCIANRTNIPELYKFEFPKDIYPNLYSSSNCNIWLGGERGKGIDYIDYKNLP